MVYRTTTTTTTVFHANGILYGLHLVSTTTTQANAVTTGKRRGRLFMRHAAVRFRALPCAHFPLLHEWSSLRPTRDNAVTATTVFLYATLAVTAVRTRTCAGVFRRTAVHACGAAFLRFCFTQTAENEQKTSGRCFIVQSKSILDSGLQRRYVTGTTKYCVNTVAITDLQFYGWQRLRAYFLSRSYCYLQVQPPNFHRLC